MDFEKLVSGHKSLTCVISVEYFPDGSYGNIRIAEANAGLRSDAETVFHRPFVPDSPYYYYLPQDKNFEDFMYRCACQGKPLHTYVHVEQMGLWVNMFLLPLESDKENVGYCLYSCDVSPYADAEQQASLAADTATAALEISIKLRGADQENFHQVFDEIIGDIRSLASAEYCSILLYDSENRQYSVFCESASSECSINAENIYSSTRFYNIAETFDAVIGGSSCAIIKDENDLKWLDSVSPGFHLLMNDHGINSVVLFPLKHNGSILGYLWALNYRTEDTVKIKETLELSTILIASEIANYQLMKQLEILSKIDMLTGCYNRNAMNNSVDDIIIGKTRLSEPSAVIFADLNGLKRINDQKGHSAGDRLIRTAAAILSQVFYDFDVYRAGGDEFMLITTGLCEAAVKSRLEQLKEQTAIASDVHFAVGYCFVGEGDDIRTAMKIADEMMYADKKEYYDKHPELKYRW